MFENFFIIIERTEGIWPCDHKPCDTTLIFKEHFADFAQQ